MPSDLVARVLRANADLSPAGGSDSGLVIAPRQDLVAIGARSDAGRVMGIDADGELVRSPWGPDELPVDLPVTATTERMASLGVLHADEDLIRVGWVVVCGTVEQGGQATRVLTPLMSRPVDLRRRPLAERVANSREPHRAGPVRVTSKGESELSQLVEDRQTRGALLAEAQFGGPELRRRSADERLVAELDELTDWIRRCAAAAGLPVDRVLGPDDDPWNHVEGPGLVAVPTLVLYLQRQVHAPSVRNSLLNWASRPGLGATALGALLDHHGDGDRGAPLGGGEVRSPLPLTASQRAVVQRARTARVCVVSGGPGSGKTHAVAAVAMDAVARGEGVLIATQSRHAADVVTDQLGRTPGPDPVRFGDGAGMATLIDELSDRSTHPVERHQLRRLDDELAQAELRVEALRATLTERLELERLAAGASEWDDMVALLQRELPVAFDPTTDLDELGAALHADPDADGGFWQWRARRRTARQRARFGLDELDPSRAVAALAAARARRAAAVLDSTRVEDLGPTWERLAAAETDRREAYGRRIGARPFESTGTDRHGRAAVAQLLTALRAGRGRRRELLAELKADQLTGPAPLWVGTLTDIEDVLPATPGLFDLVVLDEASQIDQSRAAPALLRGRRAVVVGDPHQLRHVSFVSDRDIDAVLAAHGLAEWRALLDPRRVSSFDLAAAIAPVDELREHFRSVPHLIEFSTERFYRGRIDLMTRHPTNEVVDAIDTVVVSPASTAGGVQDTETDAVLRILDELAAAGEHDVGIVSPFRAQADAIESRLIDERTAEQLAELSLRIGTVHEFQGGERDVVIISLGLHPDAPPGRRRFAEQADLFNVMTTRARRRVIVVTSLTTDAGGLVGDYLRHAESPPAPEPGAGDRVDPWSGQLADGLAEGDAVVRRGYPVGPWHLDVVVGDGPQCVALETRVAPDGVAAHIERHLTLHRLGWTLRDAYPSTFGGDPARAVVTLLGDRSP